MNVCMWLCGWRNGVGRIDRVGMTVTRVISRGGMVIIRAPTFWEASVCSPSLLSCTSFQVFRGSWKMQDRG